MSLFIEPALNASTFIVLASVKATALVALVLLVQKLGGRLLSAQGRFLLWIPVVVSLVTPVGFDMALLPATATAVPRPANIADAPQLPATQNTLRSEAGEPPAYSLPVQSAAARTRATSTPSYSWGAVLPYVWLAGVFGVLGAIAAASWRFARLVRRAVPAADEVQDFLKECMRQTGCTARARVLLSTDVTVPMIAGLFRPVLLLPADLTLQLSRAQLRHVFIHELMHLQRGDIFGNWIVALAQALHWFNPVIWFAFARLRHDRELACDAATLKHLSPSDRAAYGHTLLQLNDALPAKPVPAVALGIVEAPSHLQRRILMLVQSSRYRNLQTAFAALMLLPLAALALSQPAPRVIEPVAAAEPTVVAPAAPRSEPAARTPVVETTTAEPAGPAAVAPATEPVIETPAPIATVPVAVKVETAFTPPTPAQLDAPPISAPLLVAANSIEPLVVNTTPVEPVPTEAFAGLAAVLQFGKEIEAVKAANISFVEEWNDIASSCEARRERLLGSVSKPCRQVTKALARSEIMQFGAECLALNARQTQLTDSFRAAEAQGLSGLNGAEAALHANAESLAAFCSRDTYASQYPAFEDLLARAEAMTYITHRGQTRAVFPNVGIGIHGSSMDTGSAAFSEPSSQGFPVFTFPAQ